MHDGGGQENESLLKAHKEEEKEKEHEEREKEKENEREKKKDEGKGTNPQPSQSTTNKPPSYARPPATESHNPTTSTTTSSRQKGGFLDFLAKVATNVTQELEVGLEKLSESIDKELHNRNVEGERHFQEEFHLPSTERLLGAYGCKVLNGDVGVSGTAYLSENYFCFHGGALKIVIPLQTILKLQKALRIREYNQATGERHRVHTFEPVPPAARGDCLQLYTNDHMIHHFFSDPLTFGPLHNMVLTFESFYRMVDETWKYANTPHSTEEEATTTYTPQRDPSFTGPPPQQGAPQQQQGEQHQPQPQPPQQVQQHPPQHTVQHLQHAEQQWQPFPQQVPSSGEWPVPPPVFTFPVPQQPVIPPQHQQQTPQPSVEDVASQLAQLAPTPHDQPKTIL